MEGTYPENGGYLPSNGGSLFVHISRKLSLTLYELLRTSVVCSQFPRVSCRRRRAVCVVAAPRRCPASSSSRRLAFGPPAPAIHPRKLAAHDTAVTEESYEASGSERLPASAVRTSSAGGDRCRRADHDRGHGGADHRRRRSLRRGMAEGATKYETWYETNPGDNIEPKQKTVGYVTYDSKFLYFGIESSDTKPAEIIAPYADHDQISGNTDDYAGVIVDHAQRRKDRLSLSPHRARRAVRRGDRRRGRGRGQLARFFLGLRGESARERAGRPRRASRSRRSGMTIPIPISGA
jgi:hypothetical protein